MPITQWSYPSADMVLCACTHVPPCSAYRCPPTGPSQQRLHVLGYNAYMCLPAAPTRTCLQRLHVPAFSAYTCLLTAPTRACLLLLQCPPTAHSLLAYSAYTCPSTHDRLHVSVNTRASTAPSRARLQHLHVPAYMYPPTAPTHARLQRLRMLSYSAYICSPTAPTCAGAK